MSKIDTLRLRPLFILTILNRETDLKHPISTQELINKLKSDYDIECERRAVWRDIDALISCGYSIIKLREKGYSYYIEQHRFTDGEINTLLDAIQSMAFLTEEHTWELMKKVADLGGGSSEKILTRTENILQFTVNKTSNTDVMHSVECIEQAIIEGKKITFNYFSLDSKFDRVYRTSCDQVKLYCVSPLKKTIKDGFYYLLALTEYHNGISIYRIDRMSNVHILDEESSLDFDPEEIEIYKKKLFGMFGGDMAKVKLKVHNDLIGMIYDIFGSEEIKFNACDENFYSFMCDVVDSPMFEAWCCSYGTKLQILQPPALIDKIRSNLQELVKLYSE